MARPSGATRPDRAEWPRVGTLDRDGGTGLAVPAEVLRAGGIRPGDQVVYETSPDGVRLVPDRLRKVYVEVTTRCNLDCVMCVRRAWTEPAGDMPLTTFRRLLDGLPDGPPESFTMTLAGYGEPLCHPEILDMISVSRARRVRVEVISNGTLIDRGLAGEIARLGVAQVTVSVDGDEAGYIEMRGGSSERALEGLRLLVDARLRTHASMAIGIAAVATRRNVANLPPILDMAKTLGLDFVSISNVVPHTPEMAEDALWNEAVWVYGFPPDGWKPRLKVGRFDLTDETRDLAAAIWGGGRCQPSPNVDDAATRNYCRFAHEGMLAVARDGRIAPCLSLLHTHSEHVNAQVRVVRQHTLGNVDERPLAALWCDPGFRAFRLRVRAFDFPPCLSCGGCPMTDTNEEDCYLTPFPSCGACLWAQGIVLCP